MINFFAIMAKDMTTIATNSSILRRKRVEIITAITFGTGDKINDRADEETIILILKFFRGDKSNDVIKMNVYITIEVGTGNGIFLVVDQSLNVRRQADIAERMLTGA